MRSDPLIQGHLTRALARTQAAVALALLASLAGLDCFFPTSYRVQAGVHGLSSVASVVVGTLLTHRAYPLLRGVRVNFESLRHWAVGSTVLNFLGAVSGNWIYNFATSCFAADSVPFCISGEWAITNVAPLVLDASEQAGLRAILKKGGIGASAIGQRRFDGWLRDSRFRRWPNNRACAATRSGSSRPVATSKR